MAFVEERGNSVRVRVDCGLDENGKKRIISKTIKLPVGISKKEKERLIRQASDEIERKVKGGSVIQNERMKFREFALGMYDKNHLSTLKLKTAQDYRAIIRDRLIPYFGEMQIENITPLDVRKWISQLDRADGSSRPLSDNSKGVWFRTLSAILGKAEEWELIESNPCKKVKQPRKPQSDVRALEEADVIKIFSKFGECDDIRKVILMKVLLLTGMRSAECSGLEWRDINFEECTIKVEREAVYVRGIGIQESTPKSQSSRRIIAIPKELADDLRTYKEIQEVWISERGDLWIGGKGDHAKLFTQFNGKPVANFTIQSWVEKFLKWCEVPYVPPHGLRHTFASILIANGVDARTTSAQLGHSSPALVYNTYANPQESAKRKSAELLGDLLSKNSKEE